jgi:hypothetical protein
MLEERVSVSKWDSIGKLENNNSKKRGDKSLPFLLKTRKIFFLRVLYYNILYKIKEAIMQKKYLVLSLGLIFSVGMSFADTQSTIYNNASSSFWDRGGYSSVRPLQMQEAQSSVINDAMTEYSNIKNDTRARVRSYKDSSEVPSSYQTDGSYDDDLYGYSSGVNNSKTIYTDSLGRLHFFGKANQFKD